MSPLSKVLRALRLAQCEWFGHDYCPYVDRKGNMTHWCLRCGEGWPK